MSAGGTFVQLLRAGKWRRYAVRSCLDPGEDGLRAMTHILIEDSDDQPSWLSLSLLSPSLSMGSRGVTPLLTSD